MMRTARDGIPSRRADDRSIDYCPRGWRLYRLTTPRVLRADRSRHVRFPFAFRGPDYSVLPKNGSWNTTLEGMAALAAAGSAWCRAAIAWRTRSTSTTSRVCPLDNVWTDTVGASFETKGLRRADQHEGRSALHDDGHRPRDLVLDPTCGSGTTAAVAEQMGPALDHHRYKSCRPCARPRTPHGRALPLLPACRLARGREARGRADRRLRRRLGPLRDVRKASSTSAFRTSR